MEQPKADEEEMDDGTVVESVNQALRDLNDCIDDLCHLLSMVAIAGQGGKHKDGFVTLVLDGCTFSKIQRTLETISNNEDRP